MKPGRVSSAERHPPPTVFSPSSTTTRRPACARAIAAASPFGPEPTTNASDSGNRALAPHETRRRPDRVERRANGRTVPDIAPLRPLAPLVDTHDLSIHLGVVLEVVGQRSERRLPEAVLLAVPAQREAQLEDRVARPHEHLGL